MDDLISREQALDAIHDWKPSDVFDEFNPTTAFTIICALPSAQPEQLTCDSCKYEKTSHDLCGSCCRGCGDYYEVQTMDDLISRQDAIDAIDKAIRIEESWVKTGLRMAKERIADLPSAQPEIIRCKECKHYQGEDSWFHCNRVTWLNGEDDFCSRGERKDG